MNYLELECLQAVETSVGGQWAVRCDPQDEGVDQADVEDTPEEVPPPMPKPHSVEGSELIELVDATHVVVASYTD